MKLFVLYSQTLALILENTDCRLLLKLVGVLYLLLLFTQLIYALLKLQDLVFYNNKLLLLPFSDPK